MSVIDYKAEDIGAMAWAVLSNSELRLIFELSDDKLDNLVFKLSEDQKDHRIKCFFDRLYIANQLAFYMTYGDMCEKDGSFRVDRLQEEDIKPFFVGRLGALNSNVKLHSAFSSMQYNIISNGGRSFFSEEDNERLERLINYVANEIIRVAKKKEAEIK